ncbi:MAG: hypothetical protein R6U63_03390 [Longimicrobiales bacterium]
MTNLTTHQSPDPTKRVRYFDGQMLTAKDLTQDQAYFLEHNRRHNRTLHGYGTVCGLAVSARRTAEGVEVVVSPGLAIDPVGREIHVPEAQRVTAEDLDDWIAQHKEDVTEPRGEPLRSLSLTLVICYAERETDPVPAPGDPCGTEEESSVPSRIADSFELRLTLDPPAQAEEEAVRRFGDLLRRIEITAGPEDHVTAEQMANLVRGLVRGLGPGPKLRSKRSDPGTLRLHPDEAHQILQVAFRVWVTEVRPGLLGDGVECAAVPGHAGVALARLEVPLGESWEMTGEVQVHQDDRPILLHTRLLQEWLAVGQ